MTRRKAKGVVHGMPSLDLFFILLLKSHIQIYHPTRRIGSWEVCLITLLKLPQNWVIYIEKGSLDNLAQVTIILDNLYWEHCQLIKNIHKIPEIEVLLGTNLNFTVKVFTWSLPNDDNICEKNILSNKFK